MSKRTIIYLLIGSLLLCSGCSLFSGIGGWLMGYDLARRETRAALLPETGVLVVRVDRSGPAAQAGIAAGDTIVAVNGIAVADVPALRNELLRYRPGDEVRISYRHDLRERDTLVTLARYADGDRPYLGIYYTARAEEPADI